MPTRPRQLAATRSAGASLFDRLIEDDAPSTHPHDVVLRDLRRLLNTRRTGSAMLDPATATVLDYGIPNFTPMSSLQDNARLADLIRNAIQIFEPRLMSPEVTLRPVDGRPDRVAGTVSGMIKSNGRTERILFPLAVDPQAGEAELLSPNS